MDESTNTLLYTATYVIIFIIAVSLAIVLFLSVNRFERRTTNDYVELISKELNECVANGSC